MSPTLWRNAASLLVAARTNYVNSNVPTWRTKTSPETITIVDDARFDYRLLFLKRSAKSGFMANTYVFPGGLIEKTDSASQWVPYLEKNASGVLSSLIKRCTQIRRPRPPLYTEIDEITCRIAAVRETFEETGLLLCSSVSSDASLIVPDGDIERLGIDIEDWRRKVYADSSQFFVLCQTFGLYPAISHLYEWSNWLTPTDIGPRRYDTIFYFTTLPEIPRISIDQQEITNVQWTTPSAILEQLKSSSLKLGPPQIYEMCRLANIQSFATLSKFVEDREPLGCSRWLPVKHLILREPPVLSFLLPGDSLYPSEGDSECNDQMPSSPSDQHGSLSESLHRLEYSSPKDAQLLCNVKDPCGHYQPLEYPNLSGKTTSSSCTAHGFGRISSTADK